MHPLLAASPRQIAFAGDWHGNTNWANGVLTSMAARGVDVVVQVGDFGRTEGGGVMQALEGRPTPAVTSAPAEFLLANTQKAAEERMVPLVRSHVVPLVE